MYGKVLYQYNKLNRTGHSPVLGCAYVRLSVALSADANERVTN